ncbi:MAG: ACP phosphodiesterase [Ferruginibacter sp.]
MNYLAHAYLSFNNPPVLLGNMISDFIKGKKQFEYPPAIQIGIQLHRAIDNFTDTHEATQQLKEFFKPQYRLYAGAFTDIVYDYFLANDKNEFADAAALKSFTENTYDLLYPVREWFGYKFGQMYPYMKTQNWLYNYRYDHGIQKSFEGMRRRAAYIPETEIAFSIFSDNKTEMQQHYEVFFPSVKNFAANTLAQLLKS